MVFSAGYYADEAADSPEVLDVALDKPSYKAGETARRQGSNADGRPGTRDRDGLRPVQHT